MSTTDREPRQSFATRGAWRAWLAENHARVTAVWLVYYKRTSGKPSVDYPASVEEALCFGWVDGIKKRLDEERYMHRFSPRRPGSRCGSPPARYGCILRRAPRRSAAGALRLPAQL